MAQATRLGRRAHRGQGRTLVLALVALTVFGACTSATPGPQAAATASPSPAPTAAQGAPITPTPTRSPGATAAPTPTAALTAPSPTRSPGATAAPTPTPTPAPTPTRSPQLVALNYTGTLTLTVKHDDWVDVGYDAQKASATAQIGFQLTLAPKSAGAPFTGSTRMTATWTGQWAAKRITGFSDCAAAPGLSGALSGSSPVTVQGSFDPAKAEQVQLWVDFPSSGGTETLTGFPKTCEPWLSSTTNMLWSASSDCKERAACTVFPRAGGVLTFGAGGAQLGFLARQYLTSKGRYDLSAQLALASEMRR